MVYKIENSHDKEYCIVMEESQEKSAEQTVNATEQTQPTLNADQTKGTDTGTSAKDAARIAELEAQLARARQEAADNWNKFLRERADLENVRKRQERLITDRVQHQKKALLNRLLEVMDNVERGLIYQDSMDLQALQQILRMFYWQMNEVMRNEGLNPVPTVGEPFNPYVHEAIEAIENSDQPEGTIVEEVRKGYTLGDETLRPARVKVSMGMGNGNTNK